jgi:hypothetical protein
MSCSCESAVRAVTAAEARLSAAAPSDDIACLQAALASAVVAHARQLQFRTAAAH